MGKVLNEFLPVILNPAMQHLNINIGGHCPFCGNDRMFIKTSEIPRLSYQTCPRCTISYGNSGLLPFSQCSSSANADISVALAKDDMLRAGIGPEAGRDPDRDPYFSLLADLSATYQGDFEALPQDLKREFLIEFSLAAERCAELNAIYISDENVRAFYDTIKTTWDGNH